MNTNSKNLTRSEPDQSDRADDKGGKLSERSNGPASGGPGDAERSPATGLGSALKSTEASGNLVLVVDAEGSVHEVLDAPPDDESVYPGELCGASIDSMWPIEISATLRDNIKRSLRSRQVRCLQLRHPELNSYYEFILVAQGRNRALLVVRDISAVQREISRLERLAYTDKLTGLPNREWFLSEIDRVAQRIRLHGGRAAVVCLEIDHLDVPGSRAPRARKEAVLRDLAARLLTSLRGANRVDADLEDARYSGVARVDTQRFGLLLANIETGDDAAAVVNRVNEVLQQPVRIDDSEQRVTVTAGIALYPQDGEAGIELYDNATTAMHDAKNSVSTQQRFHSGTVQMRALERQDLELELKSALENDEFALTYLPIVERGGGPVAAVEALLRWPRPLSGSISTRELIAAADYTGLILPIGEWVFASACRQIAAWHEDGHPDLRVTVNVSAQEFARANLVERTQRLLEETGVDPRFVTIEITEHLLFRDATSDFSVCQGLRELGVSISVDDYGTGICTFDTLSRSPVDVVKIHETFVAGIAVNEASRSACAAVVAMAHELGLRVVAEGIEIAEQAAALEDIGCDYLQGYLYCMPASPEEISAYLRKRAGDGGSTVSSTDD